MRDHYCGQAAPPAGRTVDTLRPWYAEIAQCRLTIQIYLETSRGLLALYRLGMGRLIEPVSRGLVFFLSMALTFYQGALDLRAVGSML